MRAVPGIAAISTFNLPSGRRTHDRDSYYMKRLAIKLPLQADRSEKTMSLKTRRKKGALMAELPPVLWVLLIFITFPLLNLATTTMRYTILLAASRDAAAAASRAKSFTVPLNSTTPSASQIATTTANNKIVGFTGVTISNVQTVMAITNITTGVTTKRTTPLTTAADSGTNLYGIEVVVTGTLSPLITYRGAFFGSLPGFTAPMTVRIASTEMCEFTQGLTQ